jgi:hypothetical protein
MVVIGAFAEAGLSHELSRSWTHHTFEGRDDDRAGGWRGRGIARRVLVIGARVRPQRPALIAEERALLDRQKL